MAFNTKKKFTKKSNIETITFRKRFDSFTEAIDDMRRSNLVIDECIGTEENGVESVYGALVDLASKYTPNPATRENMHWEFQISAKKVSIKTGKFVSFGWNILSTKNTTEDKTVYENSYNCRITLFGNNQAIAIKLLEDNGWVADTDEE